MSDIKRTQEEIIERIERVRSTDLFGAEVGNFLSALDYEHAKPFLVDGLDEETFNAAVADTSPLKMAREYLEFAVEKAVGHRGLSAVRSLDNYRAWVWLLAPDRFDEFEALPYRSYGAPALAAAATMLGFEGEWERLVKENPRIVPMSEGKPCAPDCQEGCGS